MSTEKPCDYCGTPIDEDDTEESFAPAHGVARTTHFAAVCRERVHAALRGEKRAHAETRAALAESQRAVAEARDKALEEAAIACFDLRIGHSAFTRTTDRILTNSALNAAAASIRGLRAQPPEATSAPEDAQAGGARCECGKTRAEHHGCAWFIPVSTRAPAKRDGGGR